MNLSKLLDLPTKMDNESHCIVLLFIEVIWDILKSDSWRNFSLVVENQPWLCEFLAHSPDWKKIQVINIPSSYGFFANNKELEMYQNDNQKYSVTQYLIMLK